jgi:hypothetical protein
VPLLLNCTAMSTWRYELLCKVWLGMEDGMWYIKTNYTFNKLT